MLESLYPELPRPQNCCYSFPRSGLALSSDGWELVGLGACVCFHQGSFIKFCQVWLSPRSEGRWMRRNALSHRPCYPVRWLLDSGVTGPAGEGQPGRAILLKSREQQALKNGGVSISEGGRREHSEAHLVACQVHWEHRSAQSPPTHLASCVSSVCMIMIPDYPLYPFTSTHLC